MPAVPGATLRDLSWDVAPVLPIFWQKPASQSIYRSDTEHLRKPGLREVALHEPERVSRLLCALTRKLKARPQGARTHQGLGRRLREPGRVGLDPFEDLRWSRVSQKKALR